MVREEIIFQSIGIIRSPHQKLSDIPIQPAFSDEIKGTVVVDPEFAEGLMDLHEFSHIYLFYYFHQCQKTCLRVKPYLSHEEHGIFATRAPHRPNKLGMSLVQLTEIKDNVLHVKGVDILDGTPLIDIKPYIQRFDSRENVRSGWQDAVSDDTASARGLRDYKKQG
jgi:tRNA-Thr(GGU) m(6)t(6)A37 methyltransferase TsaA